MGIVNVTPDSFSDGGKFLHRDAAIRHAVVLAEEGADLLDIGGESTRPYATPVELDLERERVLPVLREVCRHVDVPVSVDTSKAAVAREAVAAGAEIINDVTGLEGDPEMTEVVRQTGAGVCVMHMQGTPQTMQDQPAYDDVVLDIFQYLRDRRDALIKAGIQADRLCLDPGIGFGKTHSHNLQLVARAGHFHQLRAPLLVGHSRKGFLAKVLKDSQANRMAATVGVALTLACQGVQVIRVHDIAPVRQALLLFEATGGIDGQVADLDDGKQCAR